MSKLWYQEAVINGVVMPTSPHKESAQSRWDHYIAPLLSFATGQGRRFIDLGCAEGFYCRQMADRGFRATGFDRNLDHARLWESAHPKGVALRELDVTEEQNFEPSSLALAACMLYWLEEEQVQELVERLRHRVASVIVMSRRKRSPRHVSDGTYEHLARVFRLWEAGPVIERGNHYSATWSSRRILDLPTERVMRMSCRSTRFRRDFRGLIDIVLSGGDWSRCRYRAYLEDAAATFRLPKYVELIQSVAEIGIVAPVKVCNGKVLDGAHRIELARYFEIPWLLVEDVTVA